MATGGAFQEMAGASEEHLTHRSWTVGRQDPEGVGLKKPRCPESRAPPGTLLPQKAKDQPQDPVVAKPSVREC